MTAGPDAPVRGFELPDRLTSSLLSTFEFSPETRARAAAVVSGGPDAVFHHLVRDQESQVGLLVARRVIHAFLTGDDTTSDDTTSDQAATDADGIAAEVREVRDRLARQVESLSRF